MHLEEVNNGRDYYLVVQLDGGGAAFKMPKKGKAQELIHHLDALIK